MLSYKFYQNYKQSHQKYQLYLLFHHTVERADTFFPEVVLINENQFTKKNIQQTKHMCVILLFRRGLGKSKTHIDISLMIKNNK